MDKSLKKKFLIFVLPSILSFALSGVYTIVDGFFIGQRLGDIGLTSITLSYPLAALIGAIGTGIGMAGAIIFTIFESQNKEKEKKECFSSTILLIISVSILLTILLIIFIRPLLSLLGAKGEVLTISIEYARVIALGSIFQLCATAFVPFIRNMGSSSFAVIAMILGFLTNIILDFVFIWVLKLGMMGAALATIIGQAITMIAAITFFILKKYKPRQMSIKTIFSYQKKILKLSVSPFGLTISPTITMLFMNYFLLLYGGEKAVAIYGCIGYVISIVYLFLQGVGDGAQPLLSSYYGRKEDSSVNYLYKLSCITAIIITLICLGVLTITKDKIGILFGSSKETNLEVSKYLIYFLSTLLLVAFVRITTSYLYATEKVILSYILVYIEPICTIILLIFLPLIFKLNGVWLSVPIAQLLTFIVAIFIKLYLNKKKITNTEDN